MREGCRSTPHPRLVFHHIPKCAGTSVNLALRDQYKRADEIYELSAIDSRLAAETTGTPLHVERERLLNRALSDSHFRLITGHFVFSSKAHDCHSASTKFVTLLRDPVERFISHFFYNLNPPDSQHFPISGSISEYLKTERAEQNARLLTRYLCGWELATNSSQALSIAKENLSKFAIVGSVAHLDVFSEKISCLFDEEVLIPWKNSNPRSREVRNQIKIESLEKIRALCAQDTELYQYALENFAVSLKK